MALYNGAAIRTRIREVLLEGRGQVRTVASTLGGEHSTGLSDEQIRHRTLVKPQIAVPFIPKRPNPSHPSEFGSVALYIIEPTIRVAYELPEEIHDQATRDSALADAEQDGDEFRQALGFPGNLSQTEAGTDTGIIDGWLQFNGDRAVVESFNDNRLEIEMSFRGHVHVTMPT